VLPGGPRRLVLGLFFLKLCDTRFDEVQAGRAEALGSGRIEWTIAVRMQFFSVAFRPGGRCWSGNCKDVRVV